MESIYSYHTFYFPFVWNNAGRLSFDEYVSNFSDLWEHICAEKYPQGNRIAEMGMNAELYYQAMQYFTESARESVFGGERNFVRCYTYRQQHIHNKALYCIKKGRLIYNLPINAIKLKIFNTGIGVLSFETENREYCTLDDVKYINEYGRRIYAPFMNSMGCYRCADSLGIAYPEGEDCCDIATTHPVCDSDCIPVFIQRLLQSTYKKLKMDTIKPAIDDRMFVACLINVTENQMQNLVNYKEDEETSKRLYELIYIDLPGNCSCPTKSMRDELLEKCIYRRWNEAGTYTAVTSNSFVTFTTAKNRYDVEIPFLIQYTHIVSLVIAQRASIIAFDAISSRLSIDFDKSGKTLTKRKIRDLLELQEDYVAFLNQHNNIEITCQEQGKEIYAMLQREMYVVENNGKLSGEIDILSDAANTANDYNLNVLAIWFAVILVLAQPAVDAAFDLVVKIISNFIGK